MLWAMKEFDGINFGDKRLDSRLVKLATTLSQCSVESIPSACNGAHEAKTAYRFFDNRKVTPEKILSAHKAATIERIKEHKLVLLLQDTSPLDYSKHFSKTGIGPIHRESHRGLLVHPLLAVTEDRLPLGLLDNKLLVRKELLREKNMQLNQ